MVQSVKERLGEGQVSVGVKNGGKRFGATTEIPYNYRDQ